MLYSDRLVYVCICFFFRIQKSKKAETIYFQFHWYLILPFTPNFCLVWGFSISYPDVAEISLHNLLSLLSISFNNLLYEGCHVTSLLLKSLWLPVSHEIKSQSFVLALKAKVKVAQSSLTLFDPMNCSPPRLLCPWGFSREQYWSG